MATASGQASRLSREDYRKRKELDELRKSGAAMPELDEDGKMINPHIPQYISKTPWYYGSDAPSLKHQTTKIFSDTRENLGGLEAKRVLHKSNDSVGGKWRKGSCENCGSMSHAKRDCLERPRKITARRANVTLGDDIKLYQPKLDYSSKRDRWHNDNGASYQSVVERYNKIADVRRTTEAQAVEKHLQDTAEKEKLRLQRKAEKLELKHSQRKAARITRRQEKKLEKRTAKRAMKPASDSDVVSIDEVSDVSSVVDESSAVSSNVSDSATPTISDDELSGNESDGFGIRDDGQVIAKIDEKNKQTVRNLRIREDTAKYLRNLDLDSAYYDPKTRAMRDNPYGPGAGAMGADGYRGDVFLRESGLVQELANIEQFANQTDAQGGEELSAFANPSLAETKYKEYKKKKEEAEKERDIELDSIYGGSSLAKPLPINVVLGQSESYVEYDQKGNAISGLANIIPTSKYIEDRLESNHSQIWGSFYDLKTDEWGYGCCKQTTRNVYCLLHAITTKNN